jgi:hypothetical protein
MKQPIKQLSLVSSYATLSVLNTVVSMFTLNTLSLVLCQTSFAIVQNCRESYSFFIVCYIKRWQAVGTSNFWTG